MKKNGFYLLVLSVLLPIFISCENNELNSEFESSKDVITVRFTGKVVNQLSSRASQDEASLKDVYCCLP